MPPSAMIPAATLVLFRPQPSGDPALLMIERGSGMAFAAGAMVFPGGRVDPGDVALAATVAPASDPLETAAQIAAIRETIEEVGIAVGLAPAPPAEAVARLRAGLARGGDFAALLAGEAVRIVPEALTPFARWRPNLHVARSFDTFFFLAEAPADAVATADGGESVHALWSTARALLDAADAGERTVIYPTRRNLERLARLGSIDAARRHAAEHPVRPITPWVEERDGTRWLCIPDDCGYPITAEPLDRASRG